MGLIEDRLTELVLAFPAPMDAPGNFEPVTVHAGIGYVAGHGPIDGLNVLVEGAVGPGALPAAARGRLARVVQGEELTLAGPLSSDTRRCRMPRR